jgi:signal transduction histidine kinase
MMNPDIALEQSFDTQVNSIDQALTEQRRLIGRELHDNLGQQLTGLGMLAGSVRKSLRHDDTEIGPAVDYLVTGLKRALSDIRSLSHALADDSAINDAKLAELLERIARQTRLQTSTDCRFLQSENVQVKSTRAVRNLYRIAQEAIHNAVRHGAPTSVDVILRRAGDEICMEVRDDGVGLSPGRVGGGVGLKNMWKRARDIGATLDIRSKADTGTVVTCTINEEVA